MRANNAPRVGQVCTLESQVFLKSTIPERVLRVRLALCPLK